MFILEEEKETKNILNKIEKFRNTTSFMDSPIESKIQAHLFLFIFFNELYSGSALRGTLPSIGKSILHQRNSIGFQRSTSTSKSLGSVLNKQPAKPPRQSLIFKSLVLLLSIH